MSDQDTNAPWRNEELLRQKYWGEEKSTTTIADEFDCTDGTISKWLNRFDIETRGVDGFSKDAPWKDKQTLRKLYVEDEMAIEDIADKFDCSPQPIRTWLEKFDIDVSANDPDAKYRDGELLEELYWSKGLSTHHKNGIPWDNRPENLEVLDHAKHAQVHSKHRDRDEGRFD